MNLWFVFLFESKLAVEIYDTPAGTARAEDPLIKAFFALMS